MNAQALHGGFTNPSHDSAYAFRGLMNAMARPGNIATVNGARPPSPLSVASGIVLLTLCDPDTPVFLAASHDTPEIRDWISFHCGAPFVAPQDCSFALGSWESLLPLTQYPVGTSEYPDRSASLIVERDKLEASGQMLHGPGIRGTASLNLPDPEQIRAANAAFPLGFDFIFTAGDRVAALPRSTRIG